MADLTPTPEHLGLHVAKPASYVAARGSFACGCGQTGTATGDAEVRALVEDYTAHHGPAHRTEGSGRR